MTAPNTNVDKQAKRHKGPLIGIVVAIILAAVAALVFTGGDGLTEDDATDGASQIEPTN